MSDDSVDLSELSEVLNSEEPGHKLARWLMAKKSQAPRMVRLFNDRVQRVSVSGDFIKTKNKENEQKANESETNNENQNLENVTNANVPAAPIEVPLPQQQANDVEGLTSQAPAAPNVSSTQTINRLGSKTPVSTSPLQKIPQTPKSSQIRPRILSSDRLRRLSFKQSNGFNARRELLKELIQSDSEVGSSYGNFSPHFQNLHGCTSTPSTRHEALQIQSPDRPTKSGYIVQKGPLPGQFLLTRANRTSVPPSEQIQTTNNQTVDVQREQATIHNVEITRQPARTSRVTDHAPQSMVLTDDESENENVENAADNCLIDDADATSTATANKNIKNTTFVRPRTPIHKDRVQVHSTVTQLPIACDNEKSPQRNSQTQIVVQTNIETEIFDDDNANVVSFHNNNEDNETIKYKNHLPHKKRKTPDCLKNYKNATQKLKTKSKRYILNRSKRSLYSETLVETTPPNVSSTTCSVKKPVNGAAPSRKRAAAKVSSVKNSEDDSDSSSQEINIDDVVDKPDDEQNSQLPKRRRSRSNSSTSSNSSSQSQEKSPAVSKQLSAAAAALAALASTQNSTQQECLKKNTEVCRRNLRSKRKRMNPNVSSSLSSYSQRHDVPSSRLPQKISAETEEANRKSLKFKSRSRLQLKRKPVPPSPQKERSASPENISLQLSDVAEPESMSDDEPQTQVCMSPIRTRSGSSSDSSPQAPSQTYPKQDNIPKQTIQEPESCHKDDAPLKKPTKKVIQKTKKRKNAKQNAVVENINKNEEYTACRRSQRERKPAKIIPYAYEIFRRAYYPEEYRTKKVEQTAVNAEKQNKVAKKPKKVTIEESNNNEQPVMSTQNDILSWLESTAPIAVTNDDNSDDNHRMQQQLDRQQDDHFLSGEHMLSDIQGNIECRYYNHALHGQKIGYLTFKPKAVKKLVTLKHSNMQFICMIGQFLCTLIKNNPPETKKYTFKAGDAFKVCKGEKYQMENLSETQNGQIIMTKLD